MIQDKLSHLLRASVGKNKTGLEISVKYRPRKLYDLLFHWRYSRFCSRSVVIAVVYTYVYQMAALEW